ncbi:MAG: YccF domain-containing protein [Bacilli bacterium]
MAVLGNILWLLFGGILMGLFCYVVGVLFCFSIIGIPFGLQLFKIGNLFFWPFGSNIIINFDAHPFANILWIIFFGIEFSISCLLIGVIFCLTIVGIPLGKQWFKLAKLALLPFGATLK